MWSEEQDNIDNRIRKAADSMRYPADDRHWDKMAMLLDEHLPEEKKKRRFLFIILLAGLLIGTGTVTIITFSKKQTIADTTDTTTTTSTKAAEKNEVRFTKTYKKNSTGYIVTNISKEDKNDISTEVPTKTLTNSSVPLLPSTLKTKKETIAKKYGTKKRKTDQKKTILVQKNDLEQYTNDGLANNRYPTDNFTSGSTLTDSSSQNLITPVTATTTTEEIKADSISATEDSKAEKISPLQNRQSKFSILLSAGTDISGIGTKAGSPQIAYGIGLGYTLSDKWTLRAGLLAAIKKYDAKPQQYHPDNYNFWVYYPNMQKIDADCFVYEIPLSVIYNFKTTKNHNWFVSAGLSSFLMKRETYDYTYKDNWGQTRYTTRTYKNEYKHWFSVLNLSGGYQYRINNKFSLLAEPYIKMPLSGVGFGHVKLNSAGVLITASIKPFSKKEK